MIEENSIHETQILYYSYINNVVNQTTHGIATFCRKDLPICEIFKHPIGRIISCKLNDIVGLIFIVR